MKERCYCLMQRIEWTRCLLPPLLQTGFWNAHPITRCQEAYRLRKGHAFMLHQETEHVATGVTAKAIKKPLNGVDAERRGLLLMKRAQPLGVGTSTLELDIVANHIDNISTEQDFLNNLFRNELTHKFILRVQQWSYRHRHRRPENAVPVDGAPGVQ